MDSATLMTQSMPQRRWLTLSFLMLVGVTLMYQLLLPGELWGYFFNILTRSCLVLAVMMRLWLEQDTKCREIWGQLLLAALLDTLASAVFSLTLMNGGEISKPIFAPLGDVLQLAAYVVIAIALLSMRKKSPVAEDWREPVLDAAVIVVALSAMTWLLVLGDISVDVEQGGLGDFLLQLGYPFLDFTLLACLWVARTTPDDVVVGSMQTGITIFVLSLFVGDSFIGVGFYLADRFQVPVLFAANVFQSSALAALGATALLATPGQRSRPDVTGGFTDRSWHLSSLAVAALFLVALYFLGRNLAYAQEVLSIELTVLVSMAVTGLMLVARQTVSSTRVKAALEALVQVRTQEMKTTAMALEASNRSLRSLTEHAPLGICACDDRGVVHSENQVWQRFREACPAVSDWHPARSLMSLEELSFDTVSGETRQFYGTQAVYIDRDGQMAGQWLMLTEVTEQKLREAQLFNLSKLASLGEMATEVAHEMNQPLNALRLAMVNAKRQLSQEEFLTDPGAFREGLSKKFDRMDDMIGRCDGLVRQMQSLGKAAPMDLRPTRLLDVLEETIKLQREKLRDVQLVNRILPDAWVQAAEKPLLQVLVNVLSNASDALVHSALRVIYIDTRRDSEHWIITVRDTGSGIDPAIKHRIFEPFFSTKEVNAGTGLGLAISFGLIRDMGGTLSIDNYAEGGAIATLTLAAVPQS